ncbi:hypothetical protein EON77_14450 [bacterium]|nr:MAG: hypothetical protein EON77_14450 [bacterium]
MNDALHTEVIARRVAGESLADIRTVRREMKTPGAVRGLVGERIREALTRHRSANSQPEPR